MVPALGRRYLDDWLASAVGNNVPAGRRNRSNSGASRPASNEPLRHGAVDGVSPVRTTGTADHDKFRADNGFPVAQVLLGTLEPFRCALVVAVAIRAAVASATDKALSLLTADPEAGRLATSGCLYSDATSKRPSRTALRIAR